MFEDRWIRAQDGLRLYCRDYPGDCSGAPAIVCLAGIARNSRDYESVAAGLQRQGWRVLCPDYRGRGRSGYDPDPSRYEPARYLDDIRHLLSAFGIHRVVVIGTSLGGLLGLGVAAAMPTSLAGLVMNDVGPDIDGGGYARTVAYIGAARAFGSLEDAIDNSKAVLNLPNLTDEEWQTVTEASLRVDSKGRYVADWDARIALPLKKKRELPDLWTLFRGVRNLPVLVLRGEYSDILSTGTFSKMQVGMPKLTGVEVPGAGHCPTLKEPVAREALDDFLAGFR